MMTQTHQSRSIDMTNLAIHLEDRSVLAIGGEEARDFLQNLITNDVDNLSGTLAIYAALLTPQGKYLYDFLLAQLDEIILLDVHAAQFADLERKLMMYRLRAAVTLDDASNQYSVHALLGEVAGLDTDPGACMKVKDGLIYRDPRTAKIGARAILPRDTAETILTDLGYVQADRSDYESRRVSLGVVDGVLDMEEEKTLLLEANFEDLNGVAFDKGCYVGQEQTARTKHRATIRNRIYPVAFPGDVPESGTAISAGGKDIGTVRSTAGHRGLARLRVETVEAGAALSAGGAPLTVEKLDL
jgi:folate-binding protein YgfZ